MKLVNVRLPKKTKEEMAKEAPCIASSEDQDRYPWGLRLSFDDEIIDKFPGLLKRKVGDKVNIEATGEVVSISSTKRQNENNRDRVEIQLTSVATMNDKEFEEGYEEATKRK